MEFGKERSRSFAFVGSIIHAEISLLVVLFSKNCDHPLGQLAQGKESSCSFIVQ